jgi:hypothetical protein
MKRRFTISLLSALAAAAMLPSMSLAASGPASDASLAQARARVERDIDMLQRDNRDYDGHRVKAIEAFQDARNQLDIALSYDRWHDYNAPMVVLPTEPNGRYYSDQNLRYVGRDVEQTIDVLQRDNTDYGGHRVAAIARLQQGRDQLEEALEADRGH